MKKICLNIIKKALAVLLGIAIVISLVPVNCFAIEDTDNKQKILVSLGDSYSSGEGIESFYGQEQSKSERVNNPDWIAHRSQNAWPGMLSLPSVNGKLSEHKNENWFFVAASGAVTDNLKYAFAKEYKKGSYKGQYILEPQLNIFDEISGEVDYVTLTLGGNDAGFTDIITTCVINGKYFNPGGLSDKLNYTWDRFFATGGIRDKLSEAYGNIADKAGSQAQIIVAGYPKLLSPGGCFMISPEEASMVNENVSKFNDAIESIVNNCRGLGMNISFVSVEEAFEGHGAYSIVPYIRKIELGAQSQDLKDIMLFSAYSMHPNEEGARAYAECVQAKIDELEKIESSGTYNNEFTIAVYDSNDYLYGNYVIKIEGKEFNGIFKWGLFKKDYSETIAVDTAKKVKIKLPKGDYTITVIDSSNKNLSYKKDVLIRPSSKNDTLSFRTGFGESIMQENDNVDVLSGEQTQLPNRGKTSDERNIVLTLDVSGSMSGTPLEETKKASEKFINTVLKEDANIGIVTYDDMSEIVSGFSNDNALLQSIVSELYDGGSTNIEAALRDAQWMLEKTNAKKKIIVLMSDGEPNRGLEGEELIAYADSIKKTGTIIYTIGFFENLYERSYAQYLMESIASDGCHYEVANADELVFFFADMADQINGQKYIYIRIACPVDVSVTYDGQTLNSAEDDLNLRTDFGTLTFEENREETSEGTDTRVKVLRLKEGIDYNLEIVGTGRGIMNYTIGFMDDDGDYSDLRKFENIKITKTTRIDTVAAVSTESVLNIDEDGDGKYDLKLRAEKNGYGEEVKIPDWIICAVAGAGILLSIDIAIIIVFKVRKNKRER